jgi:hypothetical protein
VRDCSYTCQGLDLIVDTNKLASVLGTISAAKDAAKDATKDKRQADAKAKEDKKSQDRAEFESKKVVVCEDFAEDIGKGVEHLCSLSVPKLKLLLKYYFGVPHALSKMRQGELQALVEDSFMARENDRDQHAKGEQQGEGGTTMNNNKKGRGNDLQMHLILLCMKQCNSYVEAT